jgi:chitinase
VLLGIGGWTFKSKFVPVAATEAGRQRFASSAVKLVADWGLDGLDIDWEYPQNSAEARDFTLLLRACRDGLDRYAAEYANGYHFSLSVASPAGPKNHRNLDLEGMDTIIDSWHFRRRRDGLGSSSGGSGRDGLRSSSNGSRSSWSRCTEQEMRRHRSQVSPL